MGRAYTLVSSVAGEDQNEKWKIFDEKQLEAAVNNNYDCINAKKILRALLRSEKIVHPTIW